MRSIVSLLLLALTACGDPFDRGQGDARLSDYLDSSVSAGTTLAAWIGGGGAREVCFLDEFTSAQNVLNRRGVSELPFDGVDRVPEGALGVLTIRADRVTMALISQRYLFEPNVCYGPDAVLRRSEESQPHWVVVGERLSDL